MSRIMRFALLPKNDSDKWQGFSGMGDRFDFVIPPTRIASLSAGSVVLAPITVLRIDSLLFEELVSFKVF
jgi:hypothetical protein